MRLVCDEDRVLLDAGPFFRFGEARQLVPFARYLGQRAVITADVDAEIELRAFSPKPHLRTHPELQSLKELGFPTGAPEELEPHLLDEVERIRSEWAEDDEHPKAHRGEISTVILARERRERLVIIDDRQGLKLAHVNGVTVIKTTHLVAEMVAAGALSEEDGEPIFRAVRHDGAAKYLRALERYREAFSNG